MSTYQQSYQKLNASQKEAVNTIEGPVMVLAGPGTGKTQVLATRIAHILTQTDVKPSNILALTFTDAAAKNMKDRVVGMMGVTGYRVPIMTFHSFCNDVIRDFPEAFPIARNAQVLSELERFSLFQQLLDTLELEILKPINRTDYYIRDIIKAISDLKKEGVSPDQFAKVLLTAWPEADSGKTKSVRLQHTKNRQKNLELLRFYQAYEAELRQSLRYDFDDMVALVVQVFQSDELVRLQYQEKFQYVLVDEYQDTNSAQNQVVDQLMSYWEEQPNLFVVGDPYQSIFRFQGASLANTASFIHRYPDAKTIVLTTGYRCSQLIYDVAHSLILGGNTNGQNEDEKSLRTLLQLANQEPLASVTTQTQPMIVLSAPSQLSEYLWISQQIVNTIAQGIAPESIAVLFRTNQEIQAFEAIFAQHGIAYETDAGEDILTVKPIQQLLKLCAVLLEIRNGEVHPDLFTVLSYDWLAVPYLTLLKLARMAHERKTSFFDLLISQPKSTQTIKDTDVTNGEWQVVADVLKKLISWINKQDNLSFTAWIELVLQESGYLTWLLQQPKKIEYLLALNTLYEEIKSQVKANHQYQLDEFLQSIATMQQHQIKIVRPALLLEKNAVRLSTVHKAKGQEWQVVFIAGLVDGKWGNSKKRNLLPLPPELIENAQVSDAEINAEERRLLYVAITRAKDVVYLSYSENIVDQTRSKAVNQSEFLVELMNNHPEQLEVRSAVDSLPKLEEQLERLLIPVNSARQLQSQEMQYLKHVVSQFSLSVSSLNKYLRSPEDFTHDVLLQLPKAKAPSMAFGTAVHTSLEIFYKQYAQQQQKPPKTFLTESFKTALANEVLTPSELQARLKHGNKVLDLYYQQIPKLVPPILTLETFFGQGQHPTYLNDIHLTGRIDRIDSILGQSNQVAVIDYKTGKVKSRNAIEGVAQTERYSQRELSLPESIRGEYKRQLVFYKLLAELSPSFTAKVTQGIFDFVEPNASGKITQHQFELHDDEVDALKKLIIEVMTEIRSLAFLSGTALELTDEIK